MKKCILTAFAGAFLSTSVLLAQTTDTPPPPPAPAQMAAHRLARLTTLLNLTAAQQSQATAIFTDEQTGTSGLRSSLRTAHKSLETAIQNNDVATIGTESAQIGTLTGQEIQARAKAEAALNAILTPDQQEKYKQLNLRGPGGPRGFGGPGGPGGPGPR